jgi:hypothetical protein
MREMLANKYLLDGYPGKIDVLYREAPPIPQEREPLQCRLIASYLRSGWTSRAAREFTHIIRTEGLQGLLHLSQGCREFLATVETPQSDPILCGLWALLGGDWLRTFEMLRHADLTSQPDVITLLDVLGGTHNP